MKNAPVPSTQEGFEEVLNDKTKVTELLADPPAWKAFLKAYNAEFIKRDPDLKAQIEEQQESVLSKFLEKNGIDLKKPIGRRLPMVGEEDGEDSANLAMYKGLGLTPQQRRQVLANGRGPGAVVSGKFKSLAEFAVAAYHGNVSRNGIDARLKDMGEGAGDQGGFLVPEEFRAELLSIALEAAIVRPRARVIPMTRETLRFPAIRDTTHASTVYGGISGNWVAEGADLSSATNEPTFAQAVLTAKKLSAYTVVSNELMADSALSLEAIIQQLFPEALAYFEDDAFIAGLGGGQPVGVLNADALISVSKETGQAATTLVYENIIKMFARCLPSSLARAVWYAHIDTLPQLLTMSLSVGTGGAPVWMPNAVGAPPLTLLGRPVLFTEKAETLGAAGDLVLADFSYYLIGDRMSMALASSPHVKFVNDQTVWRIIERVDGRPWLDSALTPRNGTNTLSPFVALAARA